MSGLNVVQWDSLRVATRAFLKGATLAAGIGERAMEEINLIRTGAVRVAGAPPGVSFAGLAPAAKTKIKKKSVETFELETDDDDEDEEPEIPEADDDEDEEEGERAALASLHSTSRQTRRAPVRAPSAARPAPDPLAAARAEGKRIADELMGRGPDPMRMTVEALAPLGELALHETVLSEPPSAREAVIDAFNVPRDLAAGLDDRQLLGVVGAHERAMRTRNGDRR
jgi:hypothetical protein